MEDLVASKTAIATSLMRALHTRADPLPLIDDSWGDQIVPKSAIDLLEQLSAPLLQSGSGEDSDQSAVDAFLRASPAYSNVILRSRYTEQALAAAVASGVNQYVLIGAGFDSYSLRRPADARGLEVFEVDHPATQSLKTQCLTESGVLADEHTHYLAADLGKERLDSALSRSSFKASEPAFFSLLGVTMYLTREANMALFQSFEQFAASGSQLVFSYVNQNMFEGTDSPEKEHFSELQKAVEAMGEPFLSGFHPDSLKEELGAIGLELEEDLDDTQLLQRYDPQGANGLSAAARSHMARIRVP